MWTPDRLIAFEDKIAARFEAGDIKAPVHLAGGNEKQLIEYFRENVRPDDWVLSTWRSHYHCLLKGVPEDELEAAIVAGRSIALCFPEHRILSSAIVGGIAPIAAGIAWAIKRSGGNERVHCFIGDMASWTGIFEEANLYAIGHWLPVHFVIEDNGMSVCTNTNEAWRVKGGGGGGGSHRMYYDLTRPHVGTGKWVSF